MRRVLGILMVIPGLLQVPLPQADFHVVRHHHGKGEVCPQHDHLLRWHPQAGEGQAVAVLHWHWLLPRSLDPSTLDALGRSQPVVHAHQMDPVQVEADSSPMIVSDDRGREGRADLGSSPGLADLAFAWIDLPPEHTSNSTSLHGVDPRGPSPSHSLSRLVRWNC